VLPVKPLRLAKTRLSVEASTRAELVLAMALDTAAAALSCPRVARVLVVTDDRRARERLRALGADVIADEPDAGLNPALRHGAQVAAAARPECGVATLSADLPALRPDELARALDAAAALPMAMLADSAGDGTTLLTAAPGVALAPAYGPGSRARHLAAGHVLLDLDDVESVRQDVDTLADLEAVRRLGAGPRTSAALAAAGSRAWDAPEGRHLTR
jgi:2-phospho-L-lactate/phosphoenolpyruvate guanylyltransferase